MHATLARCRDEIRAAVAGLTGREAGAAPEGKWSIAAILDHLDLTYARNADGLARRLEKGTPPAPIPVTARQRIGRLLITTLRYFPAGREAPASVVPQGRRFEELIVVIEPHLLVLDQRLTEAARVFGARRPVVNHPILGPFSVQDWRRFHLTHTRHHIRQIRALRESAPRTA